MPALQFIPPPRSLRHLRGVFPLSQARRLVLPADSGPATDALAQRIVDEIGQRTGTPAFLSEGDGAIECTTDPSAAPQSYTLAISPRGVAITAADDTGTFYALQTLLQIVRQCATELPR